MFLVLLLVSIKIRGYYDYIGHTPFLDDVCSLCGHVEFKFSIRR